MPHSEPSSDEETAFADFRQSRASINRLVASAASGVYAIYLRTPGLLAPIAEGKHGLLYIGLSTNLTSREFEQHFSSGNTGFSTFRRSIGALLKDRLSLRAIPRAFGPSETNVCNYRFNDDSEARLTTWMREHLEVGVHASNRFLELENVLIPALRPVLNLTKWANPHRAEIKRLRKICADEARAARQSSHAG
jgi:hypothetical protein